MVTNELVTSIAFDAMLAVVPAYLAHLKGLGFRRWWFYSFCALPFAFLHAICAQPKSA